MKDIYVERVTSMQFVDWMDLRIDKAQGKLLYGIELENNKIWIVSLDILQAG